MPAADPSKAKLTLVKVTIGGGRLFSMIPYTQMAVPAHLSARATQSIYYDVPLNARVTVFAPELAVAFVVASCQDASNVKVAFGLALHTEQVGP